MPGPKITVTIIVLNEEANIRDCLESVRWADEVIVSDSGSADNTAELCRKRGAKVFQDQWLGYGRQKNLCQDRAANEWILNVDADERIPPELREEIQAAVLRDGADGYLIPRKNYFNGVWVRRCGWYPDYNLRLYRKSAGRFVERRVHESVHLEGKKGRLKSPMIHLTYRDTTDYLSRMQRYSTLAAEDMLSEGRTASVLDLFVRPQFTFLTVMAVAGVVGATRRFKATL